MKDIIRKVLIYIGIAAFFAVLAYGFAPQVLQGKIVDQSDISAYLGMSHETTSWNAEHKDDRTAWTNSMFGGMPTVMLTGNQEGDCTQWLYNLFLTGKRPASYLLLSLLGAFLLMLALGISPLLAVGGAVAVTFCSYNFQIIQVGHNSKMLALAFLPWVLAAVIFTYRRALRTKGKWLPLTALGAALFALALNFQIKANHVQISYYLAIMIFSYVIVLIVWVLRKHRELLGRFAAASALLLVLGCLGIGSNANKLIPTYLYTQHTMRGGSELSQDGQEVSGKSKGLDLSYATAWSYGWEELPNLMIPDFNGGSSSHPVDPAKSETIKLLKSAGQTNTRQIAKALPLYWGPQPFTAGPMYMGAITVFLFILGLCLIRGKEKWWLLIPTVIGVFLALGNHFMAFTEFWYYHIPFYSKFRTVSMALVILQFTLPMLGFLTLDRIVKGGYDAKTFRKGGLTAFAIVGGFCLLCLLIPGIAGSFTGSSDAGQPDLLVEAFTADRVMLLKNDALMALVFITLAFGALYWSHMSSKGNKSLAGALVCLLVVVNMFSVGKRYLNSEHFVTPRQFEGKYTERPVDKMILEDNDGKARVLDLTVNVFNDATPSYFHQNIGGYSPVKLQRYQDLTDHYLSPEINSLYKAVSTAKTVQEAQDSIPYLPLLSMMDCKYIILGGDNAPIINPYAYGNAWFVDETVSAASADEEIALLGSVDLRRAAVLRDSDALGGWSKSSDAVIERSSYAPNELVYKYSASETGLAVFSEIYYPNGWTAWLEDGSSVPLFRADWTLRAAMLPAGEHTLTMRFEPQSYKTSSSISRASSIALLLMLLLAGGASFMIKPQITQYNEK